jgi:integrase
VAASRTIEAEEDGTRALSGCCVSCPDPWWLLGGRAHAGRAPQRRARWRVRRGAAQRRRLDELETLTEACKGRYRDVVPVLALAGLRWGGLAGLQVGDRVSVPGPGLRLRRAMLAGGGGGALYVDTLKTNRARTVPLVVGLVPIVDRWSAGKAPDAWLFDAPESGPMRESNWKRSVAGVPLPWRLGSPGSGSMICGIRGVGMAGC